MNNNTGSAAVLRSLKCVTLRNTNLMRRSELASGRVLLILGYPYSSYFGSLVALTTFAIKAAMVGA